jgi:hypothetical protein
MVEVFKTNVKNKHKAKKIIDQIHKTFDGYFANFDLEDCDKILRIKYTGNSLRSSRLIELLKNWEVQAEVLPDNDSSNASEQLLHPGNKKFRLYES